MSVHKDRLIQAAELLGMDPDDLLSRLDAVKRPESQTDAMLADARQCADEGLQGHALRRYRRLDEMLSAGAELPQAWSPRRRSAPAEYHVQFALPDGEPDWQLYAGALTSEQATRYMVEAEANGRYRARIVPIFRGAV